MTKLVLLFSYTCLLSSMTLAADIGLVDFTNKWSGQYTSISEGNKPGFQRITTDAEGAPSFVELELEDPVSLKYKFIRVKIRVNSIDSWGGIELRVSSDESYENYYKIPVPFFNDRDFNILQDKQWATHTFTFGNGEMTGTPDLEKIKRIGFYIQGRDTLDDARFEVDLKEFSIENSLSSAVVSLTFDDGYDDQFKAAQIMNEYNLRGTAYIMPRQISSPKYLSVEQLITLNNDYGWGISSHHAIPITELTPTQRAVELKNNSQFFNQVEKNFTFFDALGKNSAFHFAYPLGRQSRQQTLPLIRETFLSARLAGGGAESLPPSDWHMLRTFNITPEITPDVLAERLDKAIANDEWLILMFHKFTDEPNPTDSLTYSYEQFREICALIQARGIPVHPVHEVYEALR